MHVLAGSPRWVQLTPERVHDQTPWRSVGGGVQGGLRRFDLGSCGSHLCDRIDTHGGCFLTRLKANANPWRVAVHRPWRGQRIERVGTRLKEVLPRLRRPVLDLEVEVACKRRASRGSQSRARRTFRWSAIRTQDTGGSHVYLTHLPADQLPAEDVQAVYALRWQGERLFKALKTHGRLEQLPSSHQAMVEAWLWAAVLAMAASQALYRWIRAAVPPHRCVPLLRWAAVFSRTAENFLRLLLHPDGSEACRLRGLLIQEAMDPHVNRKKRAINLARA